MVLDIILPVSNHAYRGVLINHASVTQEYRDITQDLRAFNKQKYKRERYVIYLNITVGQQVDKSNHNNTGTELYTGTKSRFNESMVMISINLAKELIDKIPSATIIILTAYNT